MKGFAFPIPRILSFQFSEFGIIVYYTRILPSIVWVLKEVCAFRMRTTCFLELVDFPSSESGSVEFCSVCDDILIKQ